MKRRTLGNLEVSAIGLGCMGMSFAYGSSDEKEAIATLHRAFELGVDFLDTAEVYGPFENEKLLAKALKGYSGKIKVATKFGFNITDKGEGWERIKGVNSQPANIRKVAEASLKRLGVETLDLFYQHRPDPAVPVEEVMNTLADLVREGKILHIGLSEVSSETLRRAQAVYPVTALQSEYSLWSRDVENDVLATCGELNIGFVPYSPLGRGFLTGKMAAPSALDENDYRRNLPRFQPEALAHNEKLVAQLTEMAAGYHCTAAQIALAWVLAKGPNIVPIPGARKIAHLEDNCRAVDITLLADDVALLDRLFDSKNIAGKRYNDKDYALVEG
ncbi:aldo/keto reductase [Erwinia sp. CGal63]|uniref:aldo/keto reductase n=1 Tax=Erwinia sp. CGal63 TaxID=2919889 RepID=UPI00300BF8BD